MNIEPKTVEQFKTVLSGSLGLSDGVVLAEYQIKAASEVLVALQDTKEVTSAPRCVVLTAPTGSGKTFIAGAVMKHLIINSDARDENVAVIWVSYDPQLNRRSSTDFEKVFGLGYSKLEADSSVIRSGLNILDLSKLGKDGLLSRSSELNTSVPFLEQLTDPATRLKKVYLFIDEAHIGSKKRATKTIIEQVVGALRAGNRTVGIVAITATPGRVYTGLFSGSVPVSVTVTRKDVIDSGGIKRTVKVPKPITDIGVGFRTVDINVACDRLLDYQKEWDQYIKDTDTEFSGPMEPLMIVQIPGAKTESDENPNVEKPNTAEEWITEIATAMLGRDTPEGHPYKFGYCLSTMTGLIEVNHAKGLFKVGPIDAADINGSDLNVVFFINALETGWDCPRAEVLLSFVARRDVTTITQILGRLLRNPARPAKLTGPYTNLDEAFLSVPFYDRKTLNGIVKQMEKEGHGTLTVAVDVTPNGDVAANRDTVDGVTEMFRVIPTHSVIKPGVTGEPRPIVRLARLWEKGERTAEIIAAHHIELFEKIHGFIEGRIQQSDSLRCFVEGEMGTTQEIMVGDLADNEVENVTLNVKLTNSDVELCARETHRIFLGTYTDLYLEWRREQLRKTGRYAILDQDGPALHAQRELAALLTGEGAQQFGEILLSHYKKVKKILEQGGKLPDPNYADLFPVPRELGLTQDGSRFGESRVVNDDKVPYRLNLELVGTEQERRQADLILAKHLYTPDSIEGLGALPSLSKTERDYVDSRLKDAATIGWYRNPERHEGEHPGALSWEYTHQNTEKLFYPDFVFVTERDGFPVLDIVEVHGIEYDMQAKIGAAETWQLAIDRIPLLRGRVTVRVISTVSTIVGRDVTEFGQVDIAIRKVREATKEHPEYTEAEIVEHVIDGWADSMDRIFDAPDPRRLPADRKNFVAGLVQLLKESSD